MKCKLWDIYQKVLAELSPDRLVSDYLESQNWSHPVDVLAVGKAAVPMALSCLRILAQSLGRGFLLTKYGHIDEGSRNALGDRFQLREAAHPVPDAAGLEATSELLKWLQRGRGDLLVLMSGGASALLVAPQRPLNLKDLMEVNSSLLQSGLPIERMNVLRKHLSRVKGGQLAQRCGSYRTIKQLLMVDICAPDLNAAAILSLVGSGCFVGDPFSEKEAREILQGLRLPPDVSDRARQAIHQTPAETSVESVILASHKSLLDRAWAEVGPSGLDHPDWQSEITGEVKEVAARFARVAKSLRKEGRTGFLIASGEPTVEIRVDQPGRGGRCQELALHFAREIAGIEGLTLLAGSSDGTDGPTEDAGALVDWRTWFELSRLLGVEELERSLACHDSGSALARLDGTLFQTGPTGQNLNDLYLLQVSSSSVSRGPDAC